MRTDSSHSQLSVKGQCVQVVHTLSFAHGVRMAPVCIAGLLAVMNCFFQWFPHGILYNYVWTKSNIPSQKLISKGILNVIFHILTVFNVLVDTVKKAVHSWYIAG